MDNLKVIIAGGGTGGHIFPAVAVGHALQRLHPGTELLFVGALGRMEMEKVPQEGFRIIGLDIAGFNRSNMLKNIMLPVKLFRSRIQARSIIRDFRPSAIVGVGGYASFPVLSAGQAMNVPTLIQEQNSFAGKSNKILGRRANAVCVAYENMERFFPAGKLIVTGNPVRQSISAMNRSAAEGRKFFGLNEEVNTILVIGGSLGARSVNESIYAGLETLMQDNVQLIWQTGKPFYETARKREAEFAGRLKVLDFIRDMDYAYGAAGLVVSRAGALAIAELCIAARPVIFVPYPFAAEDHQTSNAMALVKRGAAMIVKDDEAQTSLVSSVKALLKDNEKQEVMKKNLSVMAIKDADERIARKVIEIALKK